MMSFDETRAVLIDLRDQMAREFPGFEIREKRVWWLWVVYWVTLQFLWMPKAMWTTWITVGYKIYMPRADEFAHPDLAYDELIRQYALLYHERQHMLDLRDVWPFRVLGPLRGPVWGFLYFCPQILALGVLGAFWTPWAWCSLLALAPWPAPFRVWVERRGYFASAEAYHKVLGNSFELNVYGGWMQRIIDINFIGWKYYRMSWSKKAIEEWFKPRLADLQHRV